MKKSTFINLEAIKKDMEKEIEKRETLKSTIIANAENRTISELTSFEEDKISMININIQEAMEIIDQINYLINRIEDFSKA